MSWECPRCRTIHSDLTPSCNCPPPTVTTTSTVVPEVALPSTTSRPGFDLSELREKKLMQYTNALESFQSSFSEFEEFFRTHYGNMEETKRLLGEATSYFDFLSHSVMDLALIEEIEGKQGKPKPVGRICPGCQGWKQWDPDTWGNIHPGVGVTYACPECVRAREKSG